MPHILAHSHAFFSCPLDVSQEMTHLCVIGGDGKIVWQGKCLSTPEAIAATSDRERLTLCGSDWKVVLYNHARRWPDRL